MYKHFLKMQDMAFQGRGRSGEVVVVRWFSFSVSRMGGAVGCDGPEL